MAEGDLESRTNAQTPQPSRRGTQASTGSPLESIVDSVKSIGSGIKKAASYAYYTAKAAAGLAIGAALTGYQHAVSAGVSLASGIASVGISPFILPAGIAFGTILSNIKNKQKTTFKQIANEVAVGGILSGILNYMFAGCAAIGNYVKSAYGKTASLITNAGLGLATMPPFLAANEYLNRAFISDYESKPLEIGKQLTGPMKWIIPPVMANFSLVPAYLGSSYQMPVSAGVSVAYGLLKGGKKEEKKEKIQQKTNPYAQPT